ncbi:hypothetical protein VZT92_019635 [Zoarces viviparus]|uniref:Uncharacterized protein n=1 Tax=Zoarces viviparus TaxID=48416 RepID=A0AAW1EM17_ZOAVI
MDKINRQRQVIKDYQKKMEAGHRVQPQTTNNNEMEVFQLKEELDKARQELTNAQLQWRKEKSAYQAKAFCHAKAFYKAQLDGQRAEMNRMGAALRETQNLLLTERLLQTTKEEMEANVDEQLGVSQLKEALHKAEEELKNVHLQCEYLMSQERFITAFRASDQQAATQTLEKAQALHKAQLEEQRAETDGITAALKETQDLLEEQRVETDGIKAALKETQDLLEAECLRLQEHLEKTFKDLDDAHLENIAALQTLKEEATQMVKGDQASQAQLEEQRAETDRMKAALKETQDLLEEQRVETDRMKAARKNTEDLLEAERRLWQQEKSSLLRAADDLQASEEYLQSLINNKQKQKKKKKWFKFF